MASLGLTKAMLVNDLNLLGFMFEGLCARDLQIYAGANGGKLYHYRDSAGREIDAVVELPDGRWGGHSRLSWGPVRSTVLPRTC